MPTSSLLKSRERGGLDSTRRFVKFLLLFLFCAKCYAGGVLVTHFHAVGGTNQTDTLNLEFTVNVNSSVANQPGKYRVFMTVIDSYGGQTGIFVWLVWDGT